MQETKTKTALVVKPIEGMSQYEETFSLKDSQFRYLQGTYPSEAGIQTRIPGKTPTYKFGSSVLSIYDFLGQRVVQTASDGLYMGDDSFFATLQSGALTQNRVRDSFASSPDVQLLVRANGEEPTKVVDTNGNFYNAEIPAPANFPGLTLQSSPAGTLTNGLWYSYRYCYAASTAYPFVAREISINGQICPRGNPSPKSTIHVTAASRSINVAIAAPSTLSPTRTDINETWIFRTVGYTTQAEADNAADAGLCYYKGKVSGFGGGSFNDTDGIDGVDQIELDNFKASNFKFVIFYDPYWIGFGGEVLKYNAVWTSGATPTITIFSPDKWWVGRDNQPFKLTGITTGGIDGKGTFLFKYVTGTTASIQSGSIPSSGSGYIIISPPCSTIYRSKANDPFAWGWTRTIGTSIESLEWALKVGGGQGTALATVPNDSILKVDLEYPSRCFAYNLQLIDNFDQFKQTQKTVSEVSSVSSHGSQFIAKTQDGASVLWGMDYRNFAIVQSNGITQNVVSTPLQAFLRNLNPNRSVQIFSHGIYDSFTDCNCMWVTLNVHPSKVHLLVYQHASTGYWGLVEDLDVLSSAKVYDSLTGKRKIMVGTETGIYGQAFTPIPDIHDSFEHPLFANWLDDNYNRTGTIISSTTNAIQVSNSITTTIGLVGNWVLITDANNQNEIWARIGSINSSSIWNIDYVFVPNYSINTLGLSLSGTGFSSPPAAGSKYYVGLIECRAFKEFDAKAPNIDKRLLELWIEQDNAVASTIRIFRETEHTKFIEEFTPAADKYKDATLSTSFIQKKMASERVKSFGLEVINREYTQWKLRNLVIKYDLVP